ncbi:putative thioredoxin-like protein [Escherichia coli]|uniref:Putative thioredoxin-like protein n=1 Tax=Escherichia coli TaxID=562 RepID=A0A2X3JP57_ECOLX|nr:putative thioredoxin-like protein [Escherichia coli]
MHADGARGVYAAVADQPTACWSRWSRSLMEITEDGYAILQFGGGCNGCSMVDVTLKEGIEKQLLNEFPELKGVRDLTEHQRGEHSYY